VAVCLVRSRGAGSSDLGSDDHNGVLFLFGRGSGAGGDVTRADLKRDARGQTDQRRADVSSGKPVVVYGASGYTGRLVVEYLREHGLPFIAAGRDAARVEEALGHVPGIG
jgi:rhodanese-related sulfurtransferase